jgi:hypothetical protein
MNDDFFFSRLFPSFFAISFSGCSVFFSSSMMNSFFLLKVEYTLSYRLLKVAFYVDEKTNISTSVE